MRVAIPLFNTRVAPRFDYARNFLLAEVQREETRSIHWVTLPGASVRGRLDVLSQLGVDLIICGGLDQASASLLLQYQIPHIAWVVGEAEDVVRRLVQGELFPGGWVGLKGGCGARRGCRNSRPNNTSGISQNDPPAERPGNPAQAVRRRRKSGSRGKGNRCR